MTQRSLILSFENATAAEANRYTQELETLVRRLDDVVEIRRAKPDPSTMDLGTVLTIVLSSGAILALARGLADWLRKRQSATITIRDEQGEIIADHLTSADAVSLAEGRLGR